MSSDGLYKLRPLPKISDMSADQVTPVVLVLLEHLEEQQEVIQQLRDAIAILKGQKPKPRPKPSTLDKPKGGEKKKQRPKKRSKRQKTRDLTIHETVDLAPEEKVPAGSRFKGYKEFTVQDLRIKVHNTRFRMEQWVTPSGERLVGKLPTELGDRHFGPTIITYILHQYHHGHVTQPLILEQLQEWGIDISAGHSCDPDVGTSLFTDRLR